MRMSVALIICSTLPISNMQKEQPSLSLPVLTSCRGMNLSGAGPMDLWAICQGVLYGEVDHQQESRCAAMYRLPIQLSALGAAFQMLLKVTI
jgi:hypothetical protein